MNIKRRSRKRPATDFKDRLMAFANDVREEARRLPAGDEKYDLIRRARHADTAAHIEDWINSPGLQPPK